MEDDFRINKPFDKNPPRLKDLVNKHIMDDVWIRDTPLHGTYPNLLTKIWCPFSDSSMLVRKIQKIDPLPPSPRT